MNLCNCNFRCICTLAALIVSVIAGVVTAFLQITGTVTATVTFLWVALVIAVVHLEVLLLTARPRGGCSKLCVRLNTVLVGLLGTIAVAAVLLAVGIVATSVLSAIGVGLLVFFATLALTGSACLIRCLTDCTE